MNSVEDPNFSASCDLQRENDALKEQIRVLERRETSEYDCAGPQKRRNMHLLCPHCRKEVEPEDLEVAYKVQKGCVCEPRDWGDPDNIPPICNAFSPISDVEIDICSHCEHERRCHA